MAHKAHFGLAMLSTARRTWHTAIVIYRVTQPMSANRFIISQPLRKRRWKLHGGMNSAIFCSERLKRTRLAVLSLSAAFCNF